MNIIYKNTKNKRKIIKKFQQEVGVIDLELKNPGRLKR